MNFLHWDNKAGYRNSGHDGDDRTGIIIIITLTEAVCSLLSSYYFTQDHESFLSQKLHSLTAEQEQFSLFK